MGLHWEDVDYVNRRLQIRRGRVQDCPEARLKTKARLRDQDLPEWAFQELLRFRETTEKEGHKPGSAVTEAFYVHATKEHRTAALALLEQRKPN